MRYYAGIGSRETPEHICPIMSQIATRLEALGFCLRSGGAEGADQAFEAGVKDPKNKQIYLPFKGFCGSTSELYLDNIRESRHAWAYEVAKKYYHSNLDRKPIKTRWYMTRNTFQVLGEDLGTEPSEFIICWTKDGKASGGTGQALRIALDLKIPIYNLKNEADKIRLSEFLRTLKACHS